MISMKMGQSQSQIYVPLRTSQQYLKEFFLVSWRIKGYLTLQGNVYFLK